MSDDHPVLRKLLLNAAYIASGGSTSICQQGCCSCPQACVFCAYICLVCLRRCLVRSIQTQAARIASSLPHIANVLFESAYLRAVVPADGKGHAKVRRLTWPAEAEIPSLGQHWPMLSEDLC
jgi:hypothetical protein